MEKDSGAGLLALGIAGIAACFNYNNSLDSNVHEYCDNPKIEQVTDLRNSVYSELGEYESRLRESIDKRVSEPNSRKQLPSLEKLTSTVDRYGSFVRDNDLSEKITDCNRAKEHRNNPQWYLGPIALMGSFALVAIGVFGGLVRSEEEKSWSK